MIKFKGICILSFALTLLLGCASPKPVADFDMIGSGCTAPCSILLENLSENADSYKWDFGDGTFSNDFNPTKSYNAGGTYTITLEASNEKGISTISKPVLIQNSIQSQLPQVNFSISNDGCVAPCQVSFSNSSTNADSYEWDFGDNQTSNATSPTHVYNNGGVFSATLKGTNQAGSNQITKSVNIQPKFTKVSITSVKLEQMPFVAPDGSGWDPFNGPDVYFDIVDVNGTILSSYSSSLYSDITQSSMPLTWNLTSPFQVNDLSQARYIIIWDYDTLDPDDYIGQAGFLFSAYTTINDHYPTTKTVSYNGVKVTLGLSWSN